VKRRRQRLLRLRGRVPRLRERLLRVRRAEMRGLREEQMRSRKGEGTEGRPAEGLKNLMQLPLQIFCLSCSCEI
jgi:hypothetical protein